MAIKIVTDSTSDLSPEQCMSLGIAVVPLMVYFGDQGFRDRIDLDSQEFYDKLVTSPQLPKTSQPSPAVFGEAYKELAEETDEILSIHISSKLSQTCNSAMLGAKDVVGKCKVEVVDSLQVSMGLGLVVMAAARAAQNGATFEEAKQVAIQAASQARTICLLNTLEYLAKGGRIGKLQFYLGSSLRHLSVFKVLPMMTIKDGEAHPLDRFRTRQKGLERLAQEVLEAKEMTDVAVCYSTTSGEAGELTEKLTPHFPQDRVYTTQFGPVLGTYIGPGAIGIAMTKA